MGFCISLTSMTYPITLYIPHITMHTLFSFWIGLIFFIYQEKKIIINFSYRHNKLKNHLKDQNTICIWNWIKIYHLLSRRTSCYKLVMESFSDYANIFRIFSRRQREEINMSAKKDTYKSKNNLASEKTDLNTSSYVIKVWVPYYVFLILAKDLYTWLALW